MKVILTIRNSGFGTVNIRSDYRHETDDTPRITRLGLNIFNELGAICGDGSKIKILKRNRQNT